MTLAETRAELATLPYHARVQRMIALGRQSENAPLLDEMERGDFDLRWLALQSGFGSRDGERALRFLDDESRLIRHCAASQIAVVGTLAQIATAFDRLLPRQRAGLLLKLHKRARHDVIEACLQMLAAREDDSLRACLPFGAPTLARQFLPHVMERFLPHHWTRLARFHPDIALEFLQADAEKADRPDAGLVYRANAVLPLTSETRALATFALVKSLARHVPLTNLRLQNLAPRLPAEVTDLVLHSETRLALPLARIAPKLDAERLLALLERENAGSERIIPWFKRIAPTLRDRLHDHFARGWQDKDGCIPLSLVALLSREHREQEARRHLNLAALAARPAQRLPYAAYLPWAEARQALDVYLRNPEPDLRVLAHATLAEAVRYHRSRLPELLTLQLARKNEQDPVRYAMLTGLAVLPPGLWKPEHLDDLSQILRNALDAADLSHTTAGVMEVLIVKMLPFYPHWCAEWIATLARERGVLRLWGLENRLSDEDMRTLAPILLPVLHSWENREGWQRIYTFAVSVGRRLRVFDALADILERMTQIQAAQYQSEGALSLLNKHRPERLATLVPALIQADPSWATRPIVYNYLHRKRQDILTPFLGFKAYKGRFSTGKTRFVLPFATGFERWTGEQQRIFARVLDEVTRDTGRDTPSIQGVITQFAALPALLPTRLIELAAPDNKPAVRDAALRALGKLDSGQGITTLLDALNDDRGRIVIYALRRALLEMPTSRALVLLRGVPMEKVTVAKEVIRLMGEMKTEEAYQELLALDARDLHRDVRIALLRAFWDFRDRAQTWDVLERAAQNPEAAVAAHVSRVPAEGLASAMQQRLLAILADLLSHAEAKVRLDTLTRCATLPVSDREQVLLPHFLHAVGSAVEDERQAGAGAVFMTYTGRDADAVAQTTRQILPNRRALTTLVSVLVQNLATNRVRLLPTARAVLAVLQTDPFTSQQRVRLGLQALPTEELLALLMQMAVTRELHADAIHAVQGTLVFVATFRTDVDMMALENALAASEDRYLRRLALAALTAQASGATGWTDGRLARLYAYRNDAAPLVAEAAQFTFPPGEA